jgi:hypothetical protein
MTPLHLQLYYSLHPCTKYFLTLSYNEKIKLAKERSQDSKVPSHFSNSNNTQERTTFILPASAGLTQFYKEIKIKDLLCRLSKIKKYKWWFHKLRKNLYKNSIYFVVKTDNALVVQNIFSFYIQILSQFVKPPRDTLLRYI